ncbi:helix-turn-helix transcriptional regulator [bacterium]|nr:helix-turn-helix transcriptional regulator [bacterium]
MKKDKKDLIVVGEAIRLERFRRKLTQDKLAEMAGIAQPQHISKIEHAEVDMKITTLFSILRALDLKLEDLIDLNK